MFRLCIFFKTSVLQKDEKNVGNMRDDYTRKLKKIPFFLKN